MHGRCLCFLQHPSTSCLLLLGPYHFPFPPNISHKVGEDAGKVGAERLSFKEDQEREMSRYKRFTGTLTEFKRGWVLNDELAPFVLRSTQVSRLESLEDWPPNTEHTFQSSLHRPPPPPTVKPSLLHSPILSPIRIEFLFLLLPPPCLCYHL